MGTRTISKNWKVEGVLTNVTNAKLSDPTGAYGVKRNDTDAVVVADGTAMTNPSTGVYESSFTDIDGIAYTAYVEIEYQSATYHFEVDLPARTSTGSMVASYNSLLERVGHFLFGKRTGFSSDQKSDIEECIHDGLRDVYAMHPWSFFRPIREIATVAPHTTGTVTVASGVVTFTSATVPTWAALGVLKIGNNYYDVDTRDSNSQVTLEDTSVTVSSASSYELGRQEYDLPTGFDSIANDSDLHYEPGQGEWYPPVTQRHDSMVRHKLQDDPYFDRPIFYSVRTVEFDPDVGSRKRLALYPTPDAAYVLKVPMVLRPVPISAGDQYPVGGEMLTQVITEACLAAAERNYDDQGREHARRFQELIGVAIRDDLERSTPTSLGRDMPAGESYGNILRDDHWARSVRMGDVTIDGVTH